MLGIEGGWGGGWGNRPLKRSTQLFRARNMLGDWLMSSPNYTRIPLRGARYTNHRETSQRTVLSRVSQYPQSKKNTFVLNRLLLSL
jgi:hypothetical protein